MSALATVENQYGRWPVGTGRDRRYRLRRLAAGTRACAVCGADISGLRLDAETCGDLCRVRRWKRDRKRLSRPPLAPVDRRPSATVPTVPIELHRILVGAWRPLARCGELSATDIATLRSQVGAGPEMTVEEVVGEAFYPSRGTDTGAVQALCHDCPVASDCLVFALVRMEKFGIWGGLSERQRRVLRRMLVAAAIPFRLTPCAWCGEEFVVTGSWARFCPDKDCAGAYNRHRDTLRSHPGRVGGQRRKPKVVVA